jgi:glyoxylase-like metal-dependent hydrolase (beta-lactamase superfamily II)
MRNLRNADRQSLVFPHESPPSFGAPIEIAPGVMWLRMPLPFALDHINLWLLAESAGWTVIDTGIANAETQALWQQVFDRAGLRPVTRIIGTHFHPDHVGLAGWLIERWDVELWMSAEEFLHAHLASAEVTPGMTAVVDRFYRRTGVDAATGARLWQRFGRYRALVSPLPFAFRRLESGMSIDIGGRKWSIITGGGHAFDQACLYCRELQVFIPGDQILPRISPHVGTWPFEPEHDALGRYLVSLDRIAAEVAEAALILPSHGLPFRGLGLRINELRSLHAARLQALEAACASPRSVAELVPVLFQRPLADEHQLALALGETTAHLHHAVSLGRLVRRARMDGAWLFVRR